METEETDEALVIRFCDRGDASAFDTLVRRHRDPVFRVAVSVLGPGGEAEAEEVAQETFLRVHHALPTFRRDARFGTWLYRIAFNQALNAKARVRLPRVPLTAVGEVPDPGPEPGATVADLGRRQALDASIARLPEVYQSALRLHYWLGHTVAEIADLLGVPPNTVKSYLHRARLSLRAHLEANGVHDA